MVKKQKMTIEDVKHIAKLAKLDLAKEEINKFQQQLLEIIDFVDQLSTMDTHNILPTSQVAGLKNVFREDEVKPSLSQDEVLANSQQKHKGYFLVKSIFG